MTTEKENKLEPQMASTTAVDLKKLPSKGLTYMKGASVSFRTYGYGEIKKIASSNLSEKEAFALVLSGIITNFDKMSLTFGDFMYLAIFRKITTLGTPKLQVPYITPVNRETRAHIFSVEDLEIQDLEVEELPLNMTFTDETMFEFMPLTVGDVFRLLDNGQLKDANSLMAAQVRNVKFEEARNYLHSVTNNDDLTDLGKIEDLLAHTIKPLEFFCTEKNKGGVDVTNKVTIRLEGRQALLMPFREQGVPARSGISFGKRNSPKPD